MFHGVVVPEHSLVVREAVGQNYQDTLMCLTDYRPCCTGSENLWWYDIREPVPDYPPNYYTRGDGIVQLYLDGTSLADGIQYCTIRAGEGDGGIRTLYVGVYPRTADHRDIQHGNGECLAAAPHGFLY